MEVSNLPWSKLIKTKLYFNQVVSAEGFEIRRIYPLQQKAAKNVYDSMKVDSRVKSVVLIGSSISIRCNIYSDLDFIVELYPAFVSREVKNEVSEKIQIACDWNADILWYDRIKQNTDLMKDMQEGVKLK